MSANHLSRATKIKSILSEDSNLLFKAGECSICKYVIGYVSVGEDLYFSGRCDCANGPLRPVELEDIATFLKNNWHIQELQKDYYVFLSKGES